MLCRVSDRSLVRGPGQGTVCLRPACMRQAGRDRKTVSKMPDVVTAALLVAPSASPTGNPLDTTDGGNILKVAAIGALVILFIVAVARTLMRTQGND
jgi:hypothetical protein